MLTYRHTLTGLEKSTRYRVDTGSANGTAAVITSPTENNPVAGSIVRSDYNGALSFNGSASPLYLRAVDKDAAVIGSAFVTSTGVLLSDKAPAVQQGLVTLAGQSGTVVLDLSQGQVFDVTLTGNVTGWSFANPGRSTQEIVVYFRQDATGSRTLAGADASIRLAGGALTLTTAASKVDSLAFRQIAGVYRELSRALNQS